MFSCGVGQSWLHMLYAGGYAGTPSAPHENHAHDSALASQERLSETRDA